MSFKTQLFIPNKMGYLKGTKRPKVDCILCCIVNKDCRVTNLTVFQNQLVGCSLNLYPYNPGHLMLFPVRHVEDPRLLTQEEQQEMLRLRNFAMDVLEKIYQPNGFNIGYNVGFASGASIAHLHQHIVPRYNRELGFVDIIGGSKIIVEDPVKTLETIRAAFEDFGKEK
jgi:ATP adenylyltransferase